MLFFFVDSFIAEFIFTLVMALKCYPLQPGGLLAFEVVVIGMCSTEAVYEEALTNFPVNLLFTFTKILLLVRSKIMLSLLFAIMAAFLSAFLDALTVTAVVIAVASGFFGVYHKVASG